MLGIEEAASMLIMILAIEGFAMSYAESNNALMSYISSSWENIEYSVRFQELAPIAPMAPNILEDLTDCSVAHFGDASHCNFTRVATINGVIYTVCCYESPDNI
ncbi:MAG: hypothetical protein ACP5K5_00955 [Candidatus Micrarchaeia archaeon]